MLKENEFAPDFTAPNENGEKFTLSAFRGKRIVLYFYPKDSTPGCTKQACSFRDANAVYKAKGIVVVGVSTDNEKSHQKFIEKQKLPFTLIADTNHQVSELYGVYGEKSLYGRKYLGITRTTFLIDEEGKIIKIFKKINVSEHAREVLEAFGE